MRIVFVTPAFERYELSDICFAQHRLAHIQLGDATSVVVADDHNIDIAKSFGFWTIREDNEYLGRRFNAGIEFAYKELKADYIVPIGSDSWIDYHYFEGLSPNIFRSATLQTIFSPDGKERSDLKVRPALQPGGVGPFVIPRAMLHKSNGRPCKDRLYNSCDLHTYLGLGEPEPEYLNLHPWQYTSFKSDPHTQPQISYYHRQIVKHAIYTTRDKPFDVLADYFPYKLIQRIKRLYGGL